MTYPGYLRPAEASTLPIAAVTVWARLFGYGRLTPGQTVLVQGSGGVAIVTLQLAVAQGARVIARTRSSGKSARLRELGAAEIVNTKTSARLGAGSTPAHNGRGRQPGRRGAWRRDVRRSITASAWGGHTSLIGFMDQQDATIFVPGAIAAGVRLQGVGVGSQKDTRDLLDLWKPIPSRLLWTRPTSLPTWPKRLTISSVVRLESGGTRPD